MSTDKDVDVLGIDISKAKFDVALLDLLQNSKRDILKG